MQDPVANLNHTFRTFATHIEVWAERHDDGSIEVHGLGHPAFADDDRCSVLTKSLARIDPTLDPDDLYDSVAALILDTLDA